jgi:PAS domain S-box-containing protein
MNNEFDDQTQKQIEIEQVDRESHLGRVIDNMLGFVGVLDTQGVLQEVNRTALSAGGLTREDVIGKAFWDCYWWAYDDDIAKKLQAAVATALTGEMVRYDVDVRMAGDSRLTIDFMLAPVKDAMGVVTHLIPSGVDISERKRAESEVQQRVTQLDLALESGRMGIWEWDIASDRVTWSAQLYDMFGFTHETFSATLAGFLKVVHPDDRHNMEQLIESAFKQTCEHHDVEFRVVRGDNEEIVWTHCRGTICRNPNGTPLSILSVAGDITERKERELSLAFLTDLHSRLATLSAADAIIAAASKSVSEYLRLSHFLIMKMDVNAEFATVVNDYCVDNSLDLTGVYTMSEFATDDERRQLAAGLPMILTDTAEHSRPTQLIKNFAALQIGSLVCAPNNRDKQLQFVVCVTKRHSTYMARK